MSYAYVVNGVVRRTGSLPQSWTLADGSTVSGFDLLDAAAQAAEGWFPLVENRPTLDPTTQMYGDPTYTVNATEVTADYPVVSLPQTLLNANDLRTKATNALTANANYLAIASPTTAQAVAQVKTLTKECNGLIRLLLGLLDSTANT